MDNSGSVVKMNRSSDPSAKTQGKFCSANRIQKLVAPARELIQLISRMRRWIDYHVATTQHPAFEKVRNLKPRFLEYWQEVCEFFKKEILARYKLFVQIQAGFQELQLIKKESLGAEVKEPLRLTKEATGPPKGFVPLPDAEIGGCARNDSLVAALAND